jgi:CheY-like chemotaxis protein
MKLLFIDDDQIEREIFFDALQSVNAHIEFDFAESCYDALYKLKLQKRPDFIFLDIQMPLRTGKECLIFIKSNPLLDHIPVVVYSGSNREEDKNECIALGAYKYLLKPSNFQTLCNELNHFFNDELHTHHSELA